MTYMGLAIILERRSGQRYEVSKYTISSTHVYPHSAVPVYKGGQIFVTPFGVVTATSCSIC